MMNSSIAIMDATDEKLFALLNAKRIVSESSWDWFFMRIANDVASRSTCKRRSVGAVAVSNRHILATGYNGAPSGFLHCTSIGCLREKLKVESGTRHELCRAVHAEQNLLAQAAHHGTCLAGSIVYCTHKPCAICMKMLINAGVQKVYFQHNYPDEFSDQLQLEYARLNQGRVFMTQISLQDEQRIGKSKNASLRGA